ncbi:hypothetical protein KSS87_002831, partial [Heliosperma pusillum]
NLEKLKTWAGSTTRPSQIECIIHDFQRYRGREKKMSGNSFRGS